MTLLIISIVLFTMIFTYITLLSLKPKDLKDFDDFECIVKPKKTNVNRVRRKR